uniref:Exostosin GT47 domain-containing protein n=1 Tax=Opuntia streptacantha TaxID=393608 RepID=A0A7C9FBK8_OPUST
MGFEVQKAFKMETRRLLWLIGLLFATVILFQCVELPKGSSVFSRSENPEKRISSFFSDNVTSPSIALVVKNPELALPLENGTSKNTSSFVATEGKDHALSPGQNGDFTPYAAVPPVAPPQPTVIASALNSSFMGTEKDDTTLPLVPGQSGDFTSYVALPPVAPPQPAGISSTLNSSFAGTEKEDTALHPGQNGNFTPYIAAPPVAPAPMVSSVIRAPLQTSELNSSTASTTPQVDSLSLENASLSPPLVHMPVQKPKPKPTPISKMPPKDVYTLSDMNEMLIQSQMSPDTRMPRWPMNVDQQLMLARSEIENAPALIKDGLYGPLYRNASMFQRSYELMEQMLKIYVYKEGDRPIFHKPPLEGIYASEGWFMKLLEANRQFVTKRPEDAHLFYLPFSSRNLEEALYVPNSHSHRNLELHLKGYVDMIAAIYPFWNRTYGADHFLVACHDWAPSETKKFMANCIRALCNADVKEGFKFGKDVSLPETYVRKAADPVRGVGGRAPSKRKTLAFFAGNMHGYLRPILLQYWGNKNDPDMQIFATLPRSKGNRNYIEYMKSSKYCICARGYEVNSPRVVEAIFYGCVPVIISDNFVPPFLETLNWESFAVFVAEKDIPNLKNILLSIPQKTYFRMHMRVRKVQQHFLWHPQPVKYDLFHMILHSIWYNRVFQSRPR